VDLYDVTNELKYLLLQSLGDLAMRQTFTKFLNWSTNCRILLIKCTF
jgi:hypothetical protein